MELSPEELAELKADALHPGSKYPVGGLFRRIAQHPAGGALLKAFAQVGVDGFEHFRDSSCFCRRLCWTCTYAISATAALHDRAVSSAHNLACVSPLMRSLAARLLWSMSDACLSVCAGATRGPPGIPVAAGADPEECDCQD